MAKIKMLAVVWLMSSLQQVFVFRQRFVSEKRVEYVFLEFNRDRVVTHLWRNDQLINSHPFKNCLVKL